MLGSMWDHVAKLLRDNGKRGQPFFIAKSVTLGNGGELKVPFQFGESTTFLWLGGFYTSDAAAVMAGADTIHGGALLEITNPAGKGPLTNGEPVPITVLFGRPGVAGEGVQALPIPFQFDGQSSVDIKFKNTVAGEHTMNVVLVGVKVLG